MGKEVPETQTPLQRSLSSFKEASERPMPMQRSYTSSFQDASARQTPLRRTMSSFGGLPREENLLGRSLSSFGSAGSKCPRCACCMRCGGHKSSKLGSNCSESGGLREGSAPPAEQFLPSLQGSASAPVLQGSAAPNQGDQLPPLPNSTDKAGQQVTH